LKESRRKPIAWQALDATFARHTTDEPPANRLPLGGRREAPGEGLNESPFRPSPAFEAFRHFLRSYPH
jgi:hypothetical protein